MLANQCALLRVEKDHWYFALHQDHSALHDKQQETLLAEALSRHFNMAIQVSIEIVTEFLSTPEKVQLKRAQKAVAAAEDSLQQNPHFRQILEQFRATIVPGSILNLKNEV